MLRAKLLRSFAACASAILIASCATDGRSPVDPVQGAAGNAADTSHVVTGAPVSAAGYDLHALWWDRRQTNLVRVSKVIDKSGGVISIPTTDLTVEFPAGALDTALTITITADNDYVAYTMEPSGTQFLKDVTITQGLISTSIYGSALRSPLYAAYIADDSVSLSGKVPALEIEPSKTLFSAANPLLPVAQVWIIRHFSRYMLASN